MTKKEKTKPLPIGAVRAMKLKTPEDLETIYANMVRIAHTSSEMIFDFARFLPGEKGPKIVSRILMSPLGAKLLLKALSDNVAKYEANFGEIKIPKKQNSLADFLFRPPQQPGDQPEDNNEKE